MISKIAVKQYLSKKLDNWDWIKDETYIEMMTEIKFLCPKFEFITKPYKHQLACFILGYYNPGFLFLLEMGLGKTLIVLNLFINLQLENKVKRCLVLVPNVVGISSWADEVKKHTKLKCIELYGDKKQRQELLNNNGDIYVLNYAGLQSMLCCSGGGKRIPDYKVIEEFKAKFQMVIFDESHMCANKKTLTFRLCDSLASTIPFKYGLTGTPFGRDPHSLFGQFYLMDKGETLGTTLGIFRAGFFKEVKNYFSGWYDYKFKESMKKQLHNRLKNKSIYYSSSEVQDLPQLVRNVIELNLPEEAGEYYQKSVQNIIEAKGNYHALENAFIRLRMICSGFLSFKNNDNDRAEIEFDVNPKLEKLIELINGISVENKIVVFNEYTLSGDIICKRLKKEKIKYQRLYGATKNKKEVLRKFLEDDKYRVFVVNSKSGGTGLNLQIANFIIYFESPVSSIVKSQTDTRVHRTGQTKRVFIYELIIKKSIEVKILEYIKEGKDLFNDLIKGKGNLF